MDDFKYKLNDKIKCPYCDHEFFDSWEYNDDDGQDIDCEECDKTFNLAVDITVKYSTSKKKME